MKHAPRTRMEQCLLRTTGLGVRAAVACASLAVLACSGEADDPNWWADDESSGDAGGSAGQSGGGGSAGSGGATGTGGVSGTTGGTGENPGTAGGAGIAPNTGADVLKGLWVWEKRVQGDVEQSGEVDKGLMRVAFGTGNNKCHYIWNEITGSDFQTECTYTIAGDMVTFHATADPDGTAAGYSCAHADWSSWNDRPATQWGRYKFVGDRLWIGVNTYWGFGGGVNGVPTNNSLKRFPFWESQGQAETEESWIVFRPATKAEWCNECNPPEMCAQ